MQNVLLVIHLIACIALVIAVMLQRSEGGALGMSGGGTGGIISGRGAAGVLVRTTMVLAAVFFTTSIVMTRLNAEQARAPTGLERASDSGSSFDFGAPATTTTPNATTPGATTDSTPGSTAATPDPLAPATPGPTTAPATPAAPPAQTAPPAATTPPQPAPATSDPLAPAPAPNQ